MIGRTKLADIELDAVQPPDWRVARGHDRRPDATGRQLRGTTCPSGAVGWGGFGTADIGDDRMPKAVYHAYGHVKKAAAIANGRSGRLPKWKADLIVRVADEVIARKLDSEFTLYVWQTGSGTQSNM